MLLCHLCHLGFRGPAIGSVPTQNMRPIADLNFPIEVLVDLDPTLYEADLEGRRLYLKDDISKLDGFFRLLPKIRSIRPLA